MTVKIVLDSAGIQGLMKSAEIQEVLKKVAQAKASGAEGNYSVEASIQSTRAACRLKPADAKTYRKNLKNNEMVKMVK